MQQLGPLSLVYILALPFACFLTLGKWFFFFSLSLNFLIWKVGTMLPSAAHKLKLCYKNSRRKICTIRIPGVHADISLSSSPSLFFVPAATTIDPVPFAILQHTWPLLATGLCTGCPFFLECSSPRDDQAWFFLVTWISFTVWDRVLGSASMSPPWRGCHFTPSLMSFLPQKPLSYITLGNFFHYTYHWH